MNTQPSQGGSSSDESSQHLESSKTNLKKAADDLAAAGTAKVQEFKDAVTEQGQQYVAGIQDRITGWEKQATNYARANPIAAMATALGIGFVLGLLRRR